MAKLKSIEKILLAIAILTACAFLVVGLINGFSIVNDKIADTISTIIGIVFWLDLLVLLPLSFFGKMRVAAAVGWLISSYIFGIITWESGIVATSIVWGGWGVLGGLILAGVGVIFTGIITSFIIGTYSGALLLIVGAALTYGTHWLAVRLGKEMDKDSHKETEVTPEKIFGNKNG